jgi:hypothetical protein
MKQMSARSQAVNVRFPETLLWRFVSQKREASYLYSGQCTNEKYSLRSDIHVAVTMNIVPSGIVQIFWKNELPSSLGLKTEWRKQLRPETLVTPYIATLCHISRLSNLILHLTNNVTEFWYYNRHTLTSFNRPVLWKPELFNQKITPAARQWFGKRHVTAATLTCAREEMFEALVCSP